MYVCVGCTSISFDILDTTDGVVETLKSEDLVEFHRLYPRIEVKNLSIFQDTVSLRKDSKNFLVRDTDKYYCNYQKLNFGEDCYCFYGGVRGRDEKQTRGICRYLLFNNGELCADTDWLLDDTPDVKVSTKFLTEYKESYLTIVHFECRDFLSVTVYSDSEPIYETDSYVEGDKDIDVHVFLGSDRKAKYLMHNGQVVMNL